MSTNSRNSQWQVSRLWSWSTMARFWSLFEPDPPEEDKGRPPTVTTVDGDAEVGTMEESEPCGIRRRNTGMKLSRGGRDYRKTRKSFKFIEEKNEEEEPPSLTIAKTIFEWYIPWKVDSREKLIADLPFLFQCVVEGNLKQLQSCLASIEASDPEGSAVDIRDDHGRQLLHFASAFGQFDIVQFLLSKGANADAVDKSGNISPLVCASVQGSQKVMEILLSHGADINRGLENFEGKVLQNDVEQESHTALSWAVRTQNVRSVAFLLNNGALISGTRIHWETAIHEAAYLGNVEILKLLLENKRNLNSLELRGGRDKNTALHIACEQAHFDCVEILLSVGSSPNKVNVRGQSPLHLVASNNDFDAMQLLIRFGAEVETRDTNERTALHNCINKATTANTIEAIECIELLLANGADIDAQDEIGYTPLITAISNGASSIVATLLQQGADLTICNKSQQSGVEVLVKKMPHALRYIKESLDLAIHVKHKDIADPECTINLNFRPIISINNSEGRMSSKQNRKGKETDLLLSFCELGHQQILAHPLIEAFLILKWQRVRNYFWVSLFANILMVILYSYFVARVYGRECPLVPKPTTYANNANNDTTEVPLGKIMPMDLKITWLILQLMIVIFVMKELFQVISSPMQYFRLLENYVQLLFVTSSMYCLLPSPIGPINFWNLCGDLSLRHDSHYGSAAIGVVVAWLLILVRLGKLPRLGLYVQMFFKVVSNFGIFITTYSGVVIAFALAFQILLGRLDSFKKIYLSFLSTLVMMTGEINLDELVKVMTDEQPLSLLTLLMIIAFVLLVVIVLMNLLVGLAVSDIQGLRSGAKVARLSRLVLAISQLESMLFTNPIFNLLPSKIVNELRRKALFARRDNMYTFCFRPHDPRDDTLPSTIQEEVVQVLEKRENEKITSMKQANRASDYKEELWQKMEKMEALLESIQMLSGRR